MKSVDFVNNCFMLILTPLSPFLLAMKVWRRPAIGHAGPSGGDFPLITREGHNILDLIFTSPIESLGKFYTNGFLSLYLKFFRLNLFVCDFNFLLPWLMFIVIAGQVAKSLDKIDGVVCHGVISKSPLVPLFPLWLFKKIISIKTIAYDKNKDCGLNLNNKVKEVKIIWDILHY